MFTKKLALNAAADLMSGSTKDQVVSQIKEHTRSLLTASNSRLYSQTIREKQLNEIHILLDHYLLLLKKKGTDYQSMVTNAYGSRDKFVVFLNQLKQAEAETIQAAKKTLGYRADEKRVKLIEAIADKKRNALADKIFKATHSPSAAKAFNS